MSDIMLHGVLLMPPELWGDSPIDVVQRHARYVEASALINQLRAEVADKVQVAATIATERALLQIENDRLRAEVAAWFKQATKQSDAAKTAEAERDAMASDDERLRVAGQRVNIEYGCDTPDAMADEIERLRAELATVKAQRDGADAACSRGADMIRRLRAELATLRAKRDKLRELLQEVQMTGGLSNDLVRDRVDAAMKEGK